MRRNINAVITARDNYRCCPAYWPVQSGLFRILARVVRPFSDIGACSPAFFGYHRPIIADDAGDLQRPEAVMTIAAISGSLKCKRKIPLECRHTPCYSEVAFVALVSPGVCKAVARFKLAAFFYASRFPASREGFGLEAPNSSTRNAQPQYRLTETSRSSE
jgi:hypothetical protein